MSNDFEMPNFSRPHKKGAKSRPEPTSREGESTGRPEPRPESEPRSFYERPEATERNRPAEENQRSPERQPKPAKARTRGISIGPFIKVRGRVLRPPQSNEIALPSALPIRLAASLVVLAVLAPLVVSALPTLVFILVVLFFVGRRIGVGGLRRPERGERPRVLVTTFRVGVPSAHDPGIIDYAVSCRLTTNTGRGSVDFAGGDEVEVTGSRFGGGRETEVWRLRVSGTRMTAGRGFGTSRSANAGLALLLLLVAAGVAYTNRHYFSRSAWDLAMLQLQEAIFLLLTLLMIIFVVKFVFRRLFR